MLLAKSGSVYKSFVFDWILYFCELMQGRIQDGAQRRWRAPLPFKICKAWVVLRFIKKISIIYLKKINVCLHPHNTKSWIRPWLVAEFDTKKNPTFVTTSNYTVTLKYIYFIQFTCSFKLVCMGISYIVLWKKVECIKNWIS